MGARLAAAASLLLLLALLPSCDREADPAEQVRAQVDAGRAVYQQHCAVCHEVEGAIGPRLTAQSLAGYATARALFDYTRLTMPYGASGTLTDEQCWQVVAYLIAFHSLAKLDAPLGPGVATELGLRPVNGGRPN